jgi:hypothetical protein
MIGMSKDEKETMAIRRMTGNDEPEYHLPRGGGTARVTTKSGVVFKSTTVRVSENCGRKLPKRPVQCGI